MTEPARRLPASAAKRLRTIVDSLPVASNRGGTGWGRRVEDNPATRGGGRATDGLFLPTGDEVTTVPFDNPFISASYQSAQFGPGDRVAFALKQDIDEYPDMVVWADMRNGIYFGDGSFDPSNAPDGQAGNIWYSRGGQAFNLAAFTGWLSMREDGGFLNLRGGADELALIVQDGTATVVRVNVAAQAEDPFRLIRHDLDNRDVFSVTPDGAVHAGRYATADRPTVTNAGGMIFDTDLGQPIWSDGSGGWVDAMGGAV